MQSPSKVALMSLMMAVLVGAGSAQPRQPDPRDGTWELNLAKSKFAGRAPKSDTRTFNVVGDEVTYTAKGVNADGKPTVRQWTARFDGEDVPFVGSPLYDSISIKRIDASTSESILKKEGKTVSRIRSVVSADGKTMTSTEMSPDGEVRSVLVFDRQ
jgi:hypothetical protein